MSLEPKSNSESTNHSASPQQTSDVPDLSKATFDLSSANRSHSPEHLYNEIKNLREGFQFYRKTAWTLILLAGGFAAKEAYLFARLQGLANDGPVPLVNNPKDIKEPCRSILAFHDADGKERLLQMPLSQVDHYRALPRQGVSYENYVTPEDPTIQKLGRILAFQGKSKEEGAHNIVDYVRRNVYYDRAEQFGNTGYIRYPLETLLGTGDCEDVAILTASLLMAADIDCVMLDYVDHVAVGIAGDFSGLYFEAPWNSTKYFFTECTSSKYAPEDFRPHSPTVIGEAWGEYAERVPSIVRLK
jgi:hypothetical protein